MSAMTGSVAALAGNAGLRLAGALDEERDRRRPRQLRGRGAGGGQRQRRHRDDGLAADPQVGPARHQDAQAGARGQDFGDGGGGVDDVLEGVEDEQRLALGERVDDLLLRRLRARLAQLQGGRDRRPRRAPDRARRRGRRSRRRPGRRRRRGPRPPPPAPAASCRRRPARSASPAASPVRATASRPPRSRPPGR